MNCIVNMWFAMCICVYSLINRHDSMCEISRTGERASVKYCTQSQLSAAAEQTRDHLHAAFHELSKLQTVHLQH